MFIESSALIAPYKTLVTSRADACSLYFMPRGDQARRLKIAEHQIPGAFTSCPFSLRLQRFYSTL